MKILYFQTIAHEMGHNLGMNHDFKGDDITDVRVQDGVKCKGYMDYIEHTNGWSPCSVADFTAYINWHEGEFCLKPLGINLSYFSKYTFLHYIKKLFAIWEKI